jgi:hypothetical protein
MAFFPLGVSASPVGEEMQKSPRNLIRTTVMTLPQAPALRVTPVRRSEKTVNKGPFPRCLLTQD